MEFLVLCFVFIWSWSESHEGNYHYNHPLILQSPAQRETTNKKRKKLLCLGELRVNLDEQRQKWNPKRGHLELGIFAGGLERSVGQSHTWIRMWTSGQSCPCRLEGQLTNHFGKEIINVPMHTHKSVMLKYTKIFRYSPSVQKFRKDK